ncbi:MAG: anti-sigma regulatory factor [Sulfurifustis sp.]
MGKVEAEANSGVYVTVASDIDIVQARRQGRALAEQIGFSASEATLVATAISELARNIVHYAKTGEILVRPVDGAGRCGITIVARDRGPGIADTKLAVREGYSTSASLGLGLPGVRRIMDEFDIVSKVGCGTTVTVTKWLR